MKLQPRLFQTPDDLLFAKRLLFMALLLSWFYTGEAKFWLD